MKSVIQFYQTSSDNSVARMIEPNLIYNMRTTHILAILIKYDQIRIFFYQNKH